MTGRQKFRQRMNRFMIVSVAVACASFGVVVAEEEAPSELLLGDGIPVIGRPGNGPPHPFVDRLGSLWLRMEIVSAQDRAAQIGGAQGRSCVVCPVEPETPEPRPERDRMKPVSDRSGPGTPFGPAH